MKWFVFALIAIVVALVLNLPVLAFAVVVGLSVFSVTGWLTNRWTSQITGHRKWSHETAEVGQLVTATVEVRNAGTLPIAWMLVEDLVPADQPKSVRQRIVLHGSRLKVARLRPGQTTQLIYQIECLYRGFYQLGPIVVETGDYYGLQRSYRVLGQPNYLLVHPKVIRIENYDIQSRRPIGEVVMTHRLFEDPTRISGVRQYQDGDPLTRIHWRATARTGQLQSKQFQPSSMSGATIVLDFHDPTYDPKHEPYRSELGITAAASIANALHEMNQQFGFISNGLDAAERIRTEGWIGDARTRTAAVQHVVAQGKLDRMQPVVVPTRKSADQIRQVLELLARLELNQGLTLAQLIWETSERMPSDASLIVLLAQPTLEAAIALGTLRRQGRAITAIINSHDHEHYVKASSILLGEGIESHMLTDDQSIATICRSQKLPR